MTEHDDLKQVLLGSPPPAPKASARLAAAEAAMTAFEESEENPTAAQGSAETARPNTRQSGLMTLWRRAMNMTLPSTRTLMMGGASLAVLTIAVMTTQELNTGPTLKPLNLEPVVVSEDKTAPSDSAVRERLDDSRQTGAETAEVRVEPTTVAEAEAPAEPSPAPSATSGANNVAQPQVAMRRQAEADQSTRLGRVQGGIAQELKAQPRPVADAEAPPTGVYQEQGRDQFEEIDPNQIKVTQEEPVSTFSVDVDSASYSFMRQALNRGVLPQKDAIRVEELINYFPYGYTGPDSRETPFANHVNVMPTPWNEDTKLVRIGIQGYELAPEEKPRSNLVFLLDTSGSMGSPNKLPLLIQSFEMLVNSLDEDDTVSIVVYAGSAGTVLEPTQVKDKSKIISALQRLEAGGSTAGGEGIRQAYNLAQQNFDADGINRVILATDGDFNVGIKNPEELKGFVERKRDSGVFLSVLGFGRGNYNDALMQTLAQNGNGNAAYIDTLSEAQKILVEEGASTLFPIAKDVKIQVEFNPNTVSNYRLIGYETRMLNREDFNNDKIDAGEIGAGHSVTALYEITPVGSEAEQIDGLRYETTQTAPSEVEFGDEYAFLKIRYKAPEADESQLITRSITTSDEAAPDTEARFAASVAAFGQLLRGGRYTGEYSYDDVIALANGAKGEDAFNYRGEFVQLVRKAKTAAALERQQ